MPNQCISNAVIDDIFSKEFDEYTFADCIILCPMNEESLKLNEQVLNKLPGDVRTYLSADEVVTDDEFERTQYPTEFLNSLTPSGMPPHRLVLKVGAVVMLLHNLNLNEGLCNDTRLLIRCLHNNTINAKVLTGSSANQTVLIPRIVLSPSSTELPFTLSRRQYPLRLAYAMTINKAPGQTFNRVGIYLERPCFSHVQLYVAFSRAKRFQDVRVQVVNTSDQGKHRDKTYTRNIVYRQIL